MTTPEAEILSNETVSVSVERQPGCQVKFTVTVEPKAVQAAYVKAVKVINKEVSIPGFRKGKAPQEVIKDRYTPQIEKEMVDIVLQTGFGEAIHLTNMHPLREGSVKKPIVQKCSKDEGAHFTISFETKPEIPSVDINAIQLKKIDVPPVTPEKIEQALGNLRFHYSQWEPITDRPVQRDDFINLDIDVLEEPQHQMMADARVGVTEEQMPAWLSDLVIGLNVGESKEGVNPTEGKDIPLRVTIKSIWKAIQPEIDDEFAKKLGLQTAEELKQKVKERLEQDFKREQERQEFNELEDFLVENYSFDLPETYIQSETKDRVESHIQKLHESKYTDKDIREHRKEIEDSIRKRAIKQLQIYFLFHKIASEHNIEVTAEDVTHELSNQVSLMATGESEINFQSEGVREHIQAIALNKKIKNYLLAQTTFI